MPRRKHRAERIRKLYRGTGLKPPKGKGVHTVKFHRCVTKVAQKNKNVNPYAVCMHSLGVKKAVRKGHRRKK